jgi:Flp pilus assembly protein TadG
MEKMYPSSNSVPAATKADCKLQRSMFHVIADEDGSAILELAAVLTLLVVCLIGAVDLGRAYYTSLELTAAAEAGAVYGISNPSDFSGMQLAAQADAPDIPGMTATTAYGCECPDGTGNEPSCQTTPTCPNNYVVYVDVATSASYNMLIKWPGFPPSINMSGRSRMRVGGD